MKKSHRKVLRRNLYKIHVAWSIIAALDFDFISYIEKHWFSVAIELFMSNNSSRWFFQQIYYHFKVNYLIKSTSNLWLILIFWDNGFLWFVLWKSLLDKNHWTQLNSFQIWLHSWYLVVFVFIKCKKNNWRSKLSCCYSCDFLHGKRALSWQRSVTTPYSSDGFEFSSWNKGKLFQFMPLNVHL